MVSKHSKTLRQQALIRAEKFKEEQAQKVKESASSVARDASAATLDTNIKINPAIGRKMHPNGTGLSPRAAHPVDRDASLVTEKASLKKALASNKKGRHAPITSVPRDDPNITRRATANGLRAAATKAFTSLPPYSGSATDTPMASFSSGTGSSAPPMVDSYGNPLSPVAFQTKMLEDVAHTHPVKTPFFSAFTKSDTSFFTFDSSTQLLTNVIAKPDLTFRAPAANLSPSIESSGKSSTSSSSSSRSIFDVLGKHPEVKAGEVTSEDKASTETYVHSYISSPQEASEESNETSPSPMPDLNDNVQRQTEPDSSLAFTCTKDSSRCVPVFATAEADVEVFEQSELEFTAQKHDSANDKPGLQNMALTLHQLASPIFVRNKVLTIAEPLSSERMFFADTNGYTRLVDMAQTLYNIEINNDDVDSDFDSIASPEKPTYSPAKSIAFSTIFESPLRTVQDAAMTSSDESEDEVDIERLFFAAINGYTRIVDPTQPMYDMDIMADDGASDFDSEYSPVKLKTSPRKLDSPLKIHQEAAISSSEDSDNGIDMNGLLDSFRTDCANLTQELDKAEGEVTPDTTLSFLEDEEVIDPRLKFLSKEAADDKGLMTKLAIAATFLKLVSLEREKLSERPLPASYTAGAVMASGIMPHTIFLGATSLAKFLSRFGDETTVSEVHGAFGDLSREGVRLGSVATMGLMGIIGRRLGRNCVW